MVRGVIGGLRRREDENGGVKLDRFLRIQD